MLVGIVPFVYFSAPAEVLSALAEKELWLIAASRIGPGRSRPLECGDGWLLEVLGNVLKKQGCSSEPERVTYQMGNAECPNYPQHHVVSSRKFAWLQFLQWTIGLPDLFKLERRYMWASKTAANDTQGISTWDGESKAEKGGGHAERRHALLPSTCILQRRSLKVCMGVAKFTQPCSAQA